MKLVKKPTAAKRQRRKLSAERHLAKKSRPQSRLFHVREYRLKSQIFVSLMPHPEALEPERDSLSIALRLCGVL